MQLLLSATAALHAAASQARSCACDEALAAALAQHLAFAVSEALAGHATPSFIFSEVTSILSEHLSSKAPMRRLLRGALLLLLAPAPPIVAPPNAGAAAISLIAKEAAKALEEHVRSSTRGGGSRCPEAAAAGATQLLLDVAQVAGNSAAIAGPLLAAMHSALLAHPKAAMRKLLVELAAAAVALDSTAGSSAAVAPFGSEAGVVLLACMANDKDAMVRAKSLAALAMVAPVLVQHGIDKQANVSANIDNGRAADGGTSPACEDAGCYSLVHKAAVTRLLDSSKAVRRSALQLVEALITAWRGVKTPIAPATSCNTESGLLGASMLLQAALSPLMTLSNAPPTSPAHDDASKAAAQRLLRLVPRALGPRPALTMLLACSVTSSSSEMLSALLTHSGGSHGESGSRSGVGNSLGGDQYQWWERALESREAWELRGLRDMCQQQPPQQRQQHHQPAAANAGGNACSTAAFIATMAALENVRRHAFAVLSAQLGAVVDDRPIPGNRAADGAPPDQQLLPRDAARRLAAAVRVLAFAGGLTSGGVGGGALSGVKDAPGPAATTDAVGEAAVLADVLELLLHSRRRAALGAQVADPEQAGSEMPRRPPTGPPLLTGAGLAAGIGYAGPVALPERQADANTVSAPAPDAAPAPRESGQSEGQPRQAQGSNPPPPGTAADSAAPLLVSVASAAAGAAACGAKGEELWDLLRACDDGIFWVLEIAALASKGPMRRHVARALRWPLVSQIDLVEGCPVRCVDLAMQVLCSFCSAEQLQQLLDLLEKRARGSPSQSEPGQEPNTAPCQGASTEAPSELTHPLARDDGCWPSPPTCAPGALASYLVLLRRLVSRYSRAEAAFRAQLAALRASDGADGGAARQPGCAGEGPDGRCGARGGSLRRGGLQGVESGDGGGCRDYLEREAQLSAEEEAARHYIESLLSEGTAPVSRVGLLMSIVAAAQAPEYARVLALQALQDLLLLSGRLADDLAARAIAAPLLSGASPPALRLQAARAAGALAARHARVAPLMLDALERVIRRELSLERKVAAFPAVEQEAGVVTASAAGVAPAPPAATGLDEAVGGGQILGAGSGANGSAQQGCKYGSHCRGGAGAAASGAGSLVAVAAATYAESVASDSLVLSSSAYATLSACLLARSHEVSAIGSALARQLLNSSPPHVQRRLLLGLLAHAPAEDGPGGGSGSAGAPRLARGPLAALLPDSLRNSEELSLALVQALAGARGLKAAAATDDGGAAGGGATDAGTAAMELDMNAAAETDQGDLGGEKLSGVAGFGGAQTPAERQQQLADAVAALLEQATPGLRSLSALLAHLQAHPDNIKTLSPQSIASLRAFASRCKLGTGAAPKDTTSKGSNRVAPSPGANNPVLGRDAGGSKTPSAAKLQARLLQLLQPPRLAVRRALGPTRRPGGKRKRQQAPRRRAGGRGVDADEDVDESVANFGDGGRAL